MSLSSFFLLLLTLLQIWLPNRFLKHPGELFFYSCIFQLIDSGKSFTYIGFRSSSITAGTSLCKAIGWISNFSSFMQVHYMAFLSIEIIIKLNNNTDHKYKIRNIIYHITALIASTILCIIIHLLGSFGENDFQLCSVVDRSLGGDISLIYVFFLLPIMWAAIYWTIHKMRVGKKRMAFSLALVVLCLTLNWIFGRFLPRLMNLINVESRAIGMFSMIVALSSGIFTGISRMMNKKLKEDLREKLVMFKLRKHKINPREKIKSGELHRLLSDLMEDDSSLSIVLSDFSGDLFDNITKRVTNIQVLLEIFVLSAIRFKLYKSASEVDESITYKFKYFHYLELSNQLKIKSIASCNDYLVYNLALSIKEYASLTFSSIRNASGLTSDNIFKSFCDPANFNTIKDLSTQEGGKSHSIVIITGDQQLVIKTINKTERKFLLEEFLQDYHTRVVNPNSKLVRIFGVYKINPSKQSFIIMESILHDREQAVIFDVKGSTVNRTVNGVDDPLRPPHGIVLKDNNYRLYQRKIFLQDKNVFIREIKADLMLMLTYDLMDYSVLLSFFNGPCPKNRYSFIDDKGQTVSIGIIDILERYGMSKKSEMKLKQFFNKKAELSVVNPEKYYSRMSAFISDFFD